jgi:hypothetical protein
MQWIETKRLLSLDGNRRVRVFAEPAGLFCFEEEITPLMMVTTFGVARALPGFTIPLKLPSEKPAWKYLG